VLVIKMGRRTSNLLRKAHPFCDRSTRPDLTRCSRGDCLESSGLNRESSDKSNRAISARNLPKHQNRLLTNQTRGEIGPDGELNLVTTRHQPPVFPGGVDSSDY